MNMKHLEAVLEALSIGPTLDSTMSRLSFSSYSS